jgi:predicted transcriptional regulator
MKRVLHVEVSMLEDALAQFGGALERTMRGEENPLYEAVGFESVAELLGVLTPARWRLIAVLRRKGASRISDLARHLGRNYENVHSDLKALMEFDIVERDANGLVSVPWDEIDVRVPLAA